MRLKRRYENLPEKPCVIVGAGDFDGFCEGYTAGFVIAADGGCNRLADFGLRPDLIVGDFDSLSDAPSGVETVRFPKDKCETDTDLAAKEAIKRAYNRFYIYGALGGRTDHVFGNAAVLINLSRNGYAAYIIGKNEVITAVTDGAVAFGADKRGTVSVFPAGEKARGVSLKGLKYELDGATLKYGETLGVSNEFIGEKSVIEVKKGTLIIVFRQGET
ncbi:MAG: thiamine diphosphokinase [Oscillospiraceae bacterium]|jgi:thiamine pyrophosphokinase|nr:thiamine diphosphokinase [Oscillospiraceae bacterium]